MVTYSQAVKICYTIASVYSKHKLTELASIVINTLQTIIGQKLRVRVDEYNAALVQLIDVQLKNDNRADALHSLENACRCIVSLGQGKCVQCCPKAPRAADINVVVYENCKAGMSHFLSHVDFHGTCSIDICIQVGRKCVEAGLFPYAEAFLHQVDPLDSSSDEMKLMAKEDIAILLREANKLIETEQAYKELAVQAKQLENYEVQTRAYLGQGEVAVKMKNTDNAYDAFQGAYDCSVLNKSKINPETSVEVCLQFGDWYKLQGDAEVAKSWYEHVITVCSKANLNCLLSGAYCRKAEVCLMLGAEEEAEDSLTEAKALGADGIDFVHMLAHQLSGELHKLQQSQCAVEAKDSYKMAAEYSDTYLNSGVCQFHVVQVDNAVTHSGMLVNRGTGIMHAPSEESYSLLCSC